MSRGTARPESAATEREGDAAPASARAASAASSWSAATDEAPEFVPATVSPDLPLAAQVKLLRAELATAQRVIGEGRHRRRALERDLEKSAGVIRDGASQRARLEAQVQAASATEEKLHRALKESREAVATLTREVEELRREAAASSRTAKSAESATASRDVRLARAEEEVARLREQLAAERERKSEVRRIRGRR